MAKKQLYFSEAERLYVNDQCAPAEIASRLRLGEKTVRLWKDEGQWDRKRAEYLASRRAFHEELYDFSRILLQSIKDDIAAGREVSPGRMFAFTKILPNILKVKDYEDVAKQAEGTAGRKTESPEEIAEAVQIALGIADAKQP